MIESISVMKLVTLYSLCPYFFRISRFVNHSVASVSSRLDSVASGSPPARLWHHVERNVLTSLLIHSSSISNEAMVSLLFLITRCNHETWLDSESFRSSVSYFSFESFHPISSLKSFSGADSAANAFFSVCVAFTAQFHR